MRWALVFLFGTAACDRFIHRSAPDASSTEPVTVTTTTSTSTPTETATTPEPAASGFLGLHVDDEEEPETNDAGTCPIAIHPFYCRRRCRLYVDRVATMHARRISNPTRAGIGMCAGYKVFAEDDATGGIVEYYDDANQLVGVTDSHRKPCGSFGKVPTCKLDIKWGPARGGLGSLRK